MQIRPYQLLQFGYGQPGARSSARRRRVVSGHDPASPPSIVGILGAELDEIVKRPARRRGHEITSITTHGDDSPTPSPLPAVLHDVSFVRDERAILAPMSWTVAADERWLVLGANGSGKTTLVRICALYEHPSTGTVDILGERLGRTDVRTLRRRIGYSSAAMAAQLRTELTATEIVMTAKHAALEPWWHRYDDADRDRAVACLARMGVASFAERPLATLSSGEQQRVLLARTLMSDPGLLLLDEPSARLDLGGREQLVGALTELTTDAQAAPLVLVTHHLDEVPPGMTHVMLLRDGQVLAAGPIERTLDAESLSACFGVDLELEHRADGRYAAFATRVSSRSRPDSI
jgi:iron complex transport system ATP-binding protein